MEKIKEGIDILKALGLPKAQQNDRSALTLLSLLELKPVSNWSESKKRMIRIHDILLYIEEKFGKKYAENTRETIRRQSLHQFEQAGIVVRNLDNPNRPTNSPNTVYEISDEALRAIKSFDTDEWNVNIQKFINIKGKLIDRYEKRKKKNLLSLKMPGGEALTLSPGKHNELQIKVINELVPRFFPTSKVVYIGDTARKLLFVDEDLLNRLNIPITEHDKLPDVVLFNEDKNQLFLIEAVTSHGPISPKRHVELDKTLTNCDAVKIYISAFPNFKEFRRHIDNIAWETEVWIATNQDHMIHFNGPKFFSVY